MIHNHLDTYRDVLKAVSPCDFDFQGYQRATLNFIRESGFQPFLLEQVEGWNKLILKKGEYVLVYRRPSTQHELFVDVTGPDAHEFRQCNIEFMHPLITYAFGMHDRSGIGPTHSPATPALAVLKINRPLSYGAVGITCAGRSTPTWELFGTKHYDEMGMLGRLTRMPKWSKTEVGTEMKKLLPQSWLP